MRTQLKRMALGGLMVVALMLAGPSLAAAADAQLYELTENMRLVGDKVVHRKATSQLMGWANRGTPLCPEDLVKGVTADTTKPCSINATGVDNIDTTTGLGPFSGTYTVVIQGDNPDDAPELVVSSGTFKGRMDFSPLFVFGIPRGTVTGKLHPKGAAAVPFDGVFRLPFFVPGFGDVYYVTDSFGPFDPKFLVPVAPDEHSLGAATVRFEITF